MPGTLYCGASLQCHVALHYTHSEILIIAGKTIENSFANVTLTTAGDAEVERNKVLIKQAVTVLAADCKVCNYLTLTTETTKLRINFYCFQCNGLTGFGSFPYC